MLVRRVQQDDFDQWFELRRALWPHCIPERHAREMHEYATHDRPFATFAAVETGGRVEGFVEASIRAGAEGCVSHSIGYIEGVYVKSALCRRGIGRSLVAAAEAWARSRGCTEMASDCDVD